MAEDIERRLRKITFDHRNWISLGIIDSIEEHADFGELLNIHLVPNYEIEIQARHLQLGSGAGETVIRKVSVGDEVLVFFPNGDPNEAIAVGGLVSNAAPTSTTEGVLKGETFSSDFGKFLNALLTAFTTASGDLVATTTAAAFTTLLANPDFTSFISKINAANYTATALETE